jgi:hypothetical protein
MMTMMMMMMTTRTPTTTMMKIIFLSGLMYFWSMCGLFNRLCGLVVRVPGYISGGPGLNTRALQEKNVVCVERGPLSFVSTT